jgi:uncharacterized membrane protein YfhO
LSRAFLASGYEIVKGDTDTINRLFSKDFKIDNTLVVEEKPAISPQVGPGQASIISYKPDEVVIKTKSDVPKLLFLSDVFDTGWKAYVDGKETKIYRTDFDFRSIGLASGEHMVRFSYEPIEFRIGLILSGLSLAALIGMAGFSIYENRHI